MVTSSYVTLQNFCKVRFPCVALCYFALRFITIQRITLHYYALCYFILRCITLLHYVTTESRDIVLQNSSTTTPNARQKFNFCRLCEIRTHNLLIASPACYHWAITALTNSPQLTSNHIKLHTEHNVIYFIDSPTNESQRRKRHIIRR